MDTESGAAAGEGEADAVHHLAHRPFARADELFEVSARLDGFQSHCIVLRSAELRQILLHVLSRCHEQVRCGSPEVGDEGSAVLDHVDHLLDISAIADNSVGL